MRPRSQWRSTASSWRSFRTTAAPPASLNAGRVTCSRSVAAYPTTSPTSTWLGRSTPPAVTTTGTDASQRTRVRTGEEKLAQFVLNKPLSNSSTGILTALNTGTSDASFSEGADCYCPVDCEEDQYIPEMSQAEVRPGDKDLVEVLFLTKRNSLLCLMRSFVAKSFTDPEGL